MHCRMIFKHKYSNCYTSVLKRLSLQCEDWGEWTYSIGKEVRDFLERSKFFFSGERPRSPGTPSALRENRTDTVNLQ